jgi:hypothetical protein
VNAEAGQRLAADIAEDRFVSGAIEACAEQLTKNLCGVRPLLSSFASEILQPLRVQKNAERISSGNGSRCRTVQ